MPRKPLAYAAPGSPRRQEILDALDLDENLMPRGRLIAAEYIAGLQPQDVTMADETTPAVSPNGTPVIPTKVVPWLVVVVVLAGAVVGLPEVGIAVPAILLGASKVITVLGSALGLASAGARK